MKTGATPGRSKRRWSFRTLIMTSLIVISIFMALYMGFFSSRLSSGVIEGMSIQLSENSINSTHSTLERIFSDAQDALTRIIRLPAVQEAVSVQDDADGGTEELSSRVSATVRTLLYTSSVSADIDFAMVSIYFKNGVKFNTLQDNPLPFESYGEGRAWFAVSGILPDRGYVPATWCGAIRIRDNMGRWRDCVYGARILYEGGTMEERGIIIYAIDERALYERYSSASKNAALMLHDGTMLSGSDKRGLGLPMQNEQIRESIIKSEESFGTLSFRDDGGAGILSYKKLAMNDMYLIAPFDYYTELGQSETSDFIRSTLLIAAGGIIISVLVSVLVSQMLSSSITGLRNVMRRVYDGDLTARFESANIADISFLGDRINDMLEAVKGFFEIQEADSQAKRSLEVSLMQSQINPHLLYNTLDSVLWALNRNDTELVEGLVMSMSEFFKLTLSGGSDRIPLEDELAMINSYIMIQRLARDKRVTLTVDIPPELMRCQINKLSLQPIVENAIRHGFSGYREDGRIDIVARKEESRLQITVTDNGIGILPEELDNIIDFLATYPPAPGQRHFGLYNVNRRIIGHSGEAFGVSIESEVGEYTRVTLDMRYDAAKEGNNAGSNDH